MFESFAPNIGGGFAKDLRSGLKSSRTLAWNAKEENIWQRSNVKNEV